MPRAKHGTGREVEQEIGQMLSNGRVLTREDIKEIATRHGMALSSVVNITAGMEAGHFKNTTGIEIQVDKVGARVVFSAAGLPDELTNRKQILESLPKTRRSSVRKPKIESHQSEGFFLRTARFLKLRW